MSDRFKGNLSFTKSVCTVTVPQPAKRLTKVLREDKEGLKGGGGEGYCVQNALILGWLCTNRKNLLYRAKSLHLRFFFHVDFKIEGHLLKKYKLS